MIQRREWREDELSEGYNGIFDVQKGSDVVGGVTLRAGFGCSVLATRMTDAVP